MERTDKGYAHAVEKWLGSGVDAHGQSAIREVESSGRSPEEKTEDLERFALFIASLVVRGHYMRQWVDRATDRLTKTSLCCTARNDAAFRQLYEGIPEQLRADTSPEELGEFMLSEECDAEAEALYRLKRRGR